MGFGVAMAQTDPNAAAAPAADPAPMASDPGAASSTTAMPKKHMTKKHMAKKHMKKMKSM